MRSKKRAWIAWLLSLMLLFSSVQAGATGYYGNLPKGPAHGSVSEFRSLSSMAGIVKIVQGKKVTYKGSSTFSAPVKRLKKDALTKKPSPISISMDPMVKQMGLNGRYNRFSVIQPLLIKINPSGEIVQVNLEDLIDEDIYVTLPTSGRFDLLYDEDGGLYLRAKKTGSGTVTIELYDGSRTSKSFSVANKVLFSSMTIGELIGSECVTLKSKTMYPGESSILLAQPKPYTATYYDFPFYAWYDYCTSAVNFTSSNTKVATIGAYGRVVALAPGKTTITAAARDGSKKKASITLTVQPYPLESFTLTESGPLTLAPGTTHQLETTFLPSAYYDKKVLWSSSDSSVAKVDSSGLVTAVSPYSSKKRGTNTVIITARSNTGLASATIPITVSYNKAASNTAYHFYGIGNSDYASAGDLPSCYNDVELMANAFTDTGLIRDTDAFVHHNLTGAEMLGVLKAIVEDTSIDENDVTVFYYSGHGTDANAQAFRGALCGIDADGSDDSGYITVNQVQFYLDQVPGTVVVILDSCLSGQFITAKSISPGKKQKAIQAFNNAWISQLSKSRATNFTTKALTSSSFSGKYKILTASEALENSWGGGDADGFGWFTYWAGLGLGRVPSSSGGGSASGPLYADKNRDSAVTLQELYKYVSTNVAKAFDPIAQQHTQVWPANDNFAVLVD